MIKRYAVIFAMCIIPVICLAGFPVTPYDDAYNSLNNLYAQYNATKSREQSSAAKLLGAATIGVSGIGGMQLVSGLAEQKVDAAAEGDMQAYLATCSCDYGNVRIEYDKSDVELPGGNALLPMVTEYKQLGADLKQRKEALGLVPGIESDIVSGATETSLYDNAAIGKTGGVYTLLSRALADESGNDATQWAEEKSSTKNRTKTGGVVGGLGVIGGTTGNIVEDAVYKKN